VTGIDAGQIFRGNDGVASLAHRRIGCRRHAIFLDLQYGGEISEALIVSGDDGAFEFLANGWLPRGDRYSRRATNKYGFVLQ
jgi:hypothetical protein